MNALDLLFVGELVVVGLIVVLLTAAYEQVESIVRWLKYRKIKKNARAVAQWRRLYPDWNE